MVDFVATFLWHLGRMRVDLVLTPRDTRTPTTLNMRSFQIYSRTALQKHRGFKVQSLETSQEMELSFASQPLKDTVDPGQLLVTHKILINGHGMGPSSLYRSHLRI